MIKEYPICKNCKYYKEDECYHKKNLRRDLVHGGMLLKHYFCLSLRADNFLESLIMNSCGRRGRWFEPKENKK